MSIELSMRLGFTPLGATVAIRAEPGRVEVEFEDKEIVAISLTLDAAKRLSAALWTAIEFAERPRPSFLGAPAGAEGVDEVTR